MKKKMQKIKQFLFRNWRYLTVIAILLFAFFFMRNLQPNEQSSQINELQLAIKNKDQSIYEIAPTGSSVTLDSLINTRSDDYYRLSFKIKARQVDSLPGNQPDYDSSHLSNIDVILIGDSGTSQNIGHFSQQFGLYTSYEEVNFKTSGRFQDVLFRKSDPNDNALIQISSPLVTSLDCRTDSCVANLKPTIVGLKNGYVTNQNMTQKSDTIFKFNRGHQNFGQIFQASEDNIGAVNLSLSIIGSGGLGSYQLSLYKATKTGSSFTVNQPALSSYFFSTQDLSTRLIKNDVYRFPLASELTPGDYYFVGLNNDQVKYNIFNTLAMLGTTDGNSYQAGQAQKIDNSHSYGDLYFEIGSAVQLTNDGQPILRNTRIEDLGNDDQLFSYKFSNSASDYLDIFSKNSDKTKQPYLDSVIGGISVPALSDNSFSYRFDTLKPFQTAKIQFQQVGGDYVNTLGYYSFDNQNWQQISVPPNSDDANQFSVILNGDNTSHVIYLKFTGDQNDIGKSVKLFGVKNLEVTGSTK
jgi:hypothetical protein